MRKIKSFFQVVNYGSNKQFDEIVDEKINDFVTNNKVSDFDVKLGCNHGERAGDSCRFINLVLIYNEYLNCKNLSDSVDNSRRVFKQNE